MLGKIRDALKFKYHPPQLAPAAPQPAPQARPKLSPPVTQPFTGSTSETAGPLVRSPDMIKGNIDHSGHLRLLAKSDPEAVKMSIEALASSRQRLTVTYGTDEVSGYMTGEGMLDILTITRNGQTVTAYPVFKAGRPWPVRITRITECENALEGQLELSAGGTTLNFFDAMYFRGRHTYAPGKDTKALLAGIAYVVARTRGQGPQEDDLLVRYEGGDIDDYVFRGTVHDVAETTAPGGKARVIKTTVRLGHESKPHDFYVCATAGATQEKVGPGDRISGIIWLQGFVLP
ncbi:MAG: hypothetical protein A4E28_02944 [Methanocella sp. PtaU1.Bin125]|nr:MAG: hypothetical protein A4E28_02944 [Methanocella sp. PtaU1.Bin125]